MANEKRLIDANALLEKLSRMIDYCKNDNKVSGLTALFQVGDAIIDCPTVDAVEVVHGRWLYEAHRESSNYRWNVTAECSECCDEKKEIWAGFFPNVPDWLARDVAMQSAMSVKLSNYCPNCGAKMDGGNDDV
jgi:hypothetical protein